MDGSTFQQDRHRKYYMVDMDWYMGWLKVPPTHYCQGPGSYVMPWGTDSEHMVYLKNYHQMVWLKRISPACYSQSNGWAELAVKTTKRIQIDSTDAYGHLCQNHMPQAMLTHQKTPNQDIEMSLVEMLFSGGNQGLPPHTLWEVSSA